MYSSRFGHSISDRNKKLPQKHGICPKKHSIKKHNTSKILKINTNLLWLSNFLMIVSRKVFCGATCPRRTGILARSVQRVSRAQADLPATLWAPWARAGPHGDARASRTLGNFISTSEPSGEQHAIYLSKTTVPSFRRLLTSRNPLKNDESIARLIYFVTCWTLNSVWLERAREVPWFYHSHVLGYPFVQLKRSSEFSYVKNKM